MLIDFTLKHVLLIILGEARAFYHFTQMPYFENLCPRKPITGDGSVNKYRQMEWNCHVHDFFQVLTCGWRSCSNFFQVHILTCGWGSYRCAYSHVGGRAAVNFSRYTYSHVGGGATGAHTHMWVEELQ